MAPETSSRLMAGAISTIREGVGTAVPAAEQIGQTGESSDREFRSTQQCNCPARRMPPRRSATKKNHLDFAGIVPVFVRLAALFIVRPLVGPEHLVTEHSVPTRTAPGLGLGRPRDARLTPLAALEDSAAVGGCPMAVAPTELACYGSESW